ncbi:flagellar hook protein [Sulfitobacter sp. M57]|uniref:flagellin n=1 Tax=unclassified Sulfitobacter TaxID=196795 RepID=UPI0023E1C3A2|nr:MULTISPECIES: flagellin [unclassified Sulfitobacter]MDF3415221.1 flagellar hook protein [Sulfitobacter sp. KE5]MDF3422702.1 flagellar hook protein [Sulfitobacter sp. KE43]MDF3433767.1 flagellar hook protein [Sulfitobacter sp. KE42]MDF3459407.1 flagellar hook protein [Sulfitobacter sp. S74]MDF3463306.1 flagellar hook protein [Sulfitobacter sp. Ks18]
MSVTNLGDLSQSYSMRLRNVSLRQDIERLTSELASGQVADVREVLAGNYSYLSDIEQRTSHLAGYAVATTEASLYAGAVQNTLAAVEQFSADLSANLLISGNSAIGVTSANTVATAQSAVEGIISAFNTQSAGRHLFSGAATDQPPLADTDMLLTAMRAALAGAATPDDLLADAEIWFADPAGFEATMYQGSADAIGPFGLSQSDSVSLDLRATDPKLREVIKLAAVAALANDPTFGFSLEEQAELFDKSGQALMAGRDGIIAVRANVGFIEERVDQITTRNAAEQTALDFAKLDLLKIDPYEAATRLEEAQFQLQSLYSVTVRMSQLSLVNFL